VNPLHGRINALQTSVSQYLRALDGLHITRVQASVRCGHACTNGDASCRRRGGMKCAKSCGLPRWLEGCRRSGSWWPSPQQCWVNGNMWQRSSGVFEDKAIAHDFWGIFAAAHCDGRRMGAHSLVGQPPQSIGQSVADTASHRRRARMLRIFPTTSMPSLRTPRKAWIAASWPITIGGNHPLGVVIARRSR
jgi:hypothetical protein